MQRVLLIGNSPADIALFGVVQSDGNTLRGDADVARLAEVVARLSLGVNVCVGPNAVACSVLCVGKQLCGFKQATGLVGIAVSVEQVNHTLHVSAVKTTLKRRVKAIGNCVDDTTLVVSFKRICKVTQPL